MTTSYPEGASENTAEEATRRLGQLAADELDGGASAAEDFAGRARFVDHVGRRRIRNAPRRWAWTALAAAAGLSLVLGSYLSGQGGIFRAEEGRDAPRLAYTVGSNAQVAGALVRAVDTGSARLEFSEGTALDLSPRSTLELQEVTARGARMRLHEGKLVAEVSPRPRADWQIEAGPFQIAVTGTRFEMDFDEPSGRLAVTLYEGGVSVSGPQGLDVALAPGHRLLVRTGDAHAQVRPLNEAYEPPASAAIEDQGGKAPPAAVKAETPPDLKEVSRKADVDWAQALSRGDAAAVLGDARSRGLEAEWASRPAADLAALIDAARYQGESALALRTIQALRRRFPGSPQALRGRFLAGRLHEQGGDPSSAAREYRGYLEQAPTGGLAAETRGRLMILLHRQGQLQSARAEARAYLRLHPQGAHAEAARKILRAQ